MAPKATTMAVLVNPNYSGTESQVRDVQEAALSLGVQLVVLRANTDSDFGEAFATSSNSTPVRSWSAPLRSSTAGASSLSC